MTISDANESDKRTRVIPHGITTIRGHAVVASGETFCKPLNDSKNELLGMDLPGCRPVLPETRRSRL